MFIFSKNFCDAEMFSQKAHFACFSFPIKNFLEIQVFEKSNPQCWLFFDKRQISWFQIFERQKTFETPSKLQFQSLQK